MNERQHINIEWHFLTNSDESCVEAQLRYKNVVMDLGNNRCWRIILAVAKFVKTQQEQGFAESERFVPLQTIATQLSLSESLVNAQLHQVHQYLSQKFQSHGLSMPSLGLVKRRRGEISLEANSIKIELLNQ